MATPVLPWDSQSNDHPKLVWRTKLDKRYLIEVERTSDYGATLRIFDHSDADSEIASWNVGLAYAAKFGPDVGDVYEWQEKCADFVDNMYAGRGRLRAGVIGSKPQDDGTDGGEPDTG